MALFSFAPVFCILMLCIFIGQHPLLFDTSLDDVGYQRTANSQCKALGLSRFNGQVAKPPA